MTFCEQRGFVLGIEAAADLIGAHRNYKLNDGRDVSNAVRDRMAENIRAISPDASLVVVRREDLERLRDGVVDIHWYGARDILNAMLGEVKP